jgi:molybdenum cofactor cytidylyltransferase
MKTIADLFEKKPVGWGLRGDPHLWAEMKAYFSDSPIPAARASLQKTLEDGFKILLGVPVSTADDIYVERFAHHGGMSAGMVSPRFWREEGIPFLLEQFDNL